MSDVEAPGIRLVCSPIQWRAAPPVPCSSGCAGLHPDFPDREEDDLPDRWAPFEGRITVGWKK